MINGAPGSASRQADEDVALARAASSGSAAALEALIVKHYDYVHAVCGRILTNPSDAEEARQEALYVIAKRIGGFRGNAAFRTWIHAIAVNCSLDVLRRLKRVPLPVDELPETPVGSPAAATVTRLDIDAALRQLAPGFREAVILRDLCDLEYAEIAEILAVPVGTVRSRIARGREQLASLLGNSFAGGSV